MQLISLIFSMLQFDFHFKNFITGLEEFPKKKSKEFKISTK